MTARTYHLEGHVCSESESKPKVVETKWQQAMEGVFCGLPSGVLQLVGGTEIYCRKVSLKAFSLLSH